MQKEQLYLIEILHQTTTADASPLQELRLYLIEILHQTTTVYEFETLSDLLYLIEILHQTTTTILVKSNHVSCILLKFYIKPQPCTGIQ